MKKITLMIFLLLCSFTVHSKEIEKFYLNPSSENLNAVVSNFPETKDTHVQLLKLIFLSCVLRTHPSYVDTIINNFETFSLDQKQTITHALYIKEGKDIFKKLNISEINFPDVFTYDMVDNVQLFFPKSPDDLRTKTMQLDYLWGAFFATGDKKYINVMLDYMKKEKNETVKSYAAENLNREGLAKLFSSHGIENDETKKLFQSTDLVESLQKQDPGNRKYLVYRFMFYTTIWWSLQANKQVPPMKIRIESKNVRSTLQAPSPLSKGEGRGGG